MIGDRGVLRRSLFDWCATHFDELSLPSKLLSRPLSTLRWRRGLRFRNGARCRADDRLESGLKRNQRVCA